LLIPGINNNYEGDAPDVGAFESQGYGFRLQVTPLYQAISPGGTAEYTIDIQPISDFSETVTISLVNLPIGLTASIKPDTLTPPGRAMLTITDTHTAPLSSGIWYSIDVFAEGGGVSELYPIGLLVGGYEEFLPVMRK
jgi:hypothetical protein